MLKKLFALTIVLIAGGTIFAGPFFHRRTCRGGSCLVQVTTSPISTGQSQEFKQEDRHVQQPWSLISEEESTSSQQPDTALEPVPGTGSRLGIGPKVPDKITHILDADTLKKLGDLLTGTQQKPPAVAISLPIADETSQRLSRILTALEWLLYAGAGLFGASKVGPFLQLAARVVSGLPSALKEGSQTPATTAAAPSSIQASGS